MPPPRALLVESLVANGAKVGPYAGMDGAVFFKVVLAKDSPKQLAALRAFNRLDGSSRNSVEGVFFSRRGQERVECTSLKGGRFRVIR